jgi:hypothetical protein
VDVTTHATCLHPPTLVAQNIGTWAAGGLGGGFGYIGIPNSVAICLDTYSGTNPNYIATQAWTNGNVGQVSMFRVGTPITDGRVYVSDLWRILRPCAVEILIRSNPQRIFST